MKQRLWHLYQKHVRHTLHHELAYKNTHMLPSLKKIVVHTGLGYEAHSPKTLESLLSELTCITAQRRVFTRSRKTIARFKIRKGSLAGLKVTLRGQRIYAFFDRLVNFALPRIRDFQGVARHLCDRNGNYSIGVESQLLFPEVCYDRVDSSRGISVSIVTRSYSKKDGCVLLESLGFPFASL
jgi:large subunit ribosomal protein L5